MKYGMVIDLKKCIGCYGCQIICKVEKAMPPGELLSRVIFYESGRHPAVCKIPLPILCMHCGTPSSPPSCVAVCPTGASAKRPDGIVTVDGDKCIGCLNCVLVCPYGARTLHKSDDAYFSGQGMTPYEEVGYQKHVPGVVEKCDFCLSRIEAGREPACVSICMTRARYFGDLDDPESEVSRLIRDGEAFHIYPDVFPGDPKDEVIPETEPAVYYLPP